MEKQQTLSPSTIKYLLDKPEAFILKFTPFYVPLSDFNKHFVAGRAFHKIAETYAITWEYKLEDWYANLEADLVDLEWLYDEQDVIDMKDYILNWYNNYNEWKIKWWQAEQLATFDMFKWIVDHVSENHVITDYKLVNKFMSTTRGWLFDPIIPYNIQLSLYAYRYFLTTWVSPTVRIMEILKISAFIEDATYIKKPDLIALCEWRDEVDAKLTKEKIVEKYSPRLPWINIYQLDNVHEIGKQIYEICNQIRLDIIDNNKEAVAKWIKDFKIFIKQTWNYSK